MKKQIDKYLKLITIGFVVSLVTLLFSITIVRSRCIQKGYKNSSLINNIELKRIHVEKLEEQIAEKSNTEALINLSKKNGFVMMQEGKTFDIQ